MNSKQKDNLLDGASAFDCTDIAQGMSVQGETASDENIEKETKRILIVDDTEDVVKLVRMYLEHHRYEVITAFDGQEGLEKAKTERPDLIVLDLMLPKMDGYQYGSIAHTVQYNDSAGDTYVFYLYNADDSSFDSTCSESLYDLHKADIDGGDTPASGDEVESLSICPRQDNPPEVSVELVLNLYVEI